MTSLPKKWLEEAISDNQIEYIEYNKFTNPIEIGEGAFGKVFKCKWEGCQFMVALKCLKVDANIDEKINKNFNDELKLLRRVASHPNVITFHGVTKDDYGQYSMILEYANGGTLRNYLKTNFTRLQWADKLCIAEELASGLLFLHEKDIIHRDLHSNNILIHDNKPKITDFGLSKQINETSKTSTAFGMPAYVEPLYLSDQQYKRDKKSDIYSFGVILWEISSGRPPFQKLDANIVTLCHHLIKGKREEPIEGTPSHYIKLYKKCWDKDPNNRPEINNILSNLNILNTKDDEPLPDNSTNYNSKSSSNHQSSNSIKNIQKVMTNLPEKWLEEAISDKQIEYIEYNQFSNSIEIGEGGFGKVFKCKWEYCQLTVALRCLKVDECIDEKMIKDFIDEFLQLASASTKSEPSKRYYVLWSHKRQLRAI
ncbi:kinase-like domain-containing protein [Gigaspora rosea]|uniref:Kinase-like domain-containing protein n=1 Tax=Gigaspora rosea TaxID=44941 RepID=A0A397V5E4_9GLOM|nr:kinase-like domain-containing protein [Gigaspora rosea]